jgi:glycogen operon protein
MSDGDGVVKIDADSVRIVKINAPAATRVELWRFATPDPAAPATRIPMVRGAEGDWTAEAPLAHGDAYALRADGPTIDGHRFHPDRWLLDPRARAIGRLPAPLDPIGVMVDPAFDWQGDTRPETPWRDTVIYEAHVKGLTATHPDVPPVWRGTFLGLTVPAVLDHLRRLGVTAIELMPIHAHVDEPRLTALGLTNYWGYNTLGFFAPDPRFAVSRRPEDAVRECQTMVRALHRAGLEVILDVVFNHTAEGPDPDGPDPAEARHGRVLSLRGLDPSGAYRTDGDRTGCGNTLDADAPAVRRLILDSLRYWAETMRVDGFRFDLAPALDRAPAAVGGLFDAIRRDPVLSARKLIVEPWDANADGYRLGAFPPGIAEWNGRFRDDTRRFWRGDASAAGALATRLAGSADVFGGRPAQDAINFVTAHDGFTLADLVSYAGRHNAANGEGGRDGEAHNLSSNAGVEGPTTEPAVTAERRARARAMLATLFVSMGVPMLSGGDESGRTQLGNNNAYCQDGPVSWTPWPGDRELAAFVARLAALRRDFEASRAERHLAPSDATWWHAAGRALTAADWDSGTLTTFGLRRHAPGGDWWIWVNTGATPVTVNWPDDREWRVALDSRDDAREGMVSGAAAVAAVSVLVLREVGPSRGHEHLPGARLPR